MARRKGTVAILTRQASYSNLIALVLAQNPDLRIRQFSSAPAALAYMRLAPVDALVCDFDLGRVPADLLAKAVDRDAGVVHKPRVIVLTRHLDRERQLAIMRAGISEVIVKPCSPIYIAERITAVLGDTGTARLPTGYSGVQTRPAAAHVRGNTPDNVVVLPAY